MNVETSSSPSSQSNSGAGRPPQGKVDFDSEERIFEARDVKAKLQVRTGATDWSAPISLRAGPRRVVSFTSTEETAAHEQRFAPHLLIQNINLADRYEKVLSFA